MSVRAANGRPPRAQQIVIAFALELGGSYWNGRGAGKLKRSGWADYRRDFGLQADCDESFRKRCGVDLNDAEELRCTPARVRCSEAGQRGFLAVSRYHALAHG